ncbi:MAG: hypothetical protein RBG13Loki_0011 [Promethearchaeota archaeon CR_4]|nr:MAG: hypothetical protein RBG13Loki_0011 [Candidatus Lokiarchaeota archaeon CR_4]
MPFEYISMVMAMEMAIKIDKQGRVVLPKEVRENYHFDPLTDLILIEQPDGILLKTKKLKVPLSAIFTKAPSLDPKKSVALDVANYDENDL